MNTHTRLCYYILSVCFLFSLFRAPLLIISPHLFLFIMPKSRASRSGANHDTTCKHILTLSEDWNELRGTCGVQQWNKQASRVRREQEIETSRGAGRLFRLAQTGQLTHCLRIVGPKFFQDEGPAWEVFNKMANTFIRAKIYRAIQAIGMRTAIERSLNLTEPGEFYTDASADWNGAGACRASHISQDGLLSTNSHPN